MEAAGQVVHVGDVQDLDAGLQQRADDLPGDLGTLTLVCRSEGLVAQDHAVRSESVDDPAHPAQLFVELPAFHGGVFFAFIVCEKALAHVGREPHGANEHAALQHQLGDTDAAQEGGLAALIGARDHDQLFAIGSDVIPNCASPQPEGPPQAVRLTGGVRSARSAPTLRQG